ncbi:hypothetical protein KSP40_PGU013975 [Platanthera guangdongensis]|uniref:Uncharacterized protein n=1 Tax=Platanthera guangdongensis TaxID=2320717 RepID=A0ABR2MMG4_9ASPA
MASLSSSARLLPAPISFPTNPNPSPHRIAFICRQITLSNPLYSSGNVQRRLAASNICEQDPLGVDLSSPSVRECFSDEELHAAVRLRIRTFNNFNQSCGIECCDAVKSPLPCYLWVKLILSST